MALLTTQSITKAGLTLVEGTASGGGDTIRVGDRIFLYIRNGDASSKTVTVDVPGNTEYGVAKPDLAVTVAAGAYAFVGPIDSTFLQPGTSPGVANITYSAVTNVKVAAVSL